MTLYFPVVKKHLVIGLTIKHVSNRSDNFFIEVLNVFCDICCIGFPVAERRVIVRLPVVL